MLEELLSGLNPKQKEAVTLAPRSALILAGAGSGKTKVLTTRVAWLIQTSQVNPLQILAVTFTNKAAKEMLIRISAMLPINTRGMWVGTFHGLCHRLLRAHYRDAGLTQAFQIMDSQDQLAMIKRLLKALNVDDEKYPARQLQYFINDAKETGLRASQVEAHDDYTRKQTELYAVYEEQCAKEGVVDFSELLLRCFELLSRNELLRAHYRQRFSHILVDEFQDTSRLQYQWLRLLAGDKNSVFAVGDDDQSIYAFRGADVANMQDFIKTFSVEEVIKLEQNYRSHGNILDAANALISHNKNRLSKSLWTSEGSGEPLRVYEAASDMEEADFIVDEVKALRVQGVPLSQAAILYRSNAQSRVLEHALFSAAIPYRVYGGLRFFERQEIKHTLAYLRLIANSDDDAAFLRVVNFPTRGIGNRGLEQLQDLAKERGLSLWKAACLSHLSGRAGTNISAFTNLVESMRETCLDLPLAEAIEHVVEASGLMQHYRSERDGADRVENLNELINAAVTFIGEYEKQKSDDANDSELTAFLSHAALEAGEHQALPGSEALQLMTVHAAKGLEFYSVFLSGLEEGLFPHENSISLQAGESGSLEEERRLMYVAITRARRRLYMSYAQSRMLHGQTRYNVASRFLQEIPEELLKRLQVENREQPATSLTRVDGMATPVSRVIEASVWRIGQNVVHAKFGQGIIINSEGRGCDARVQVNFHNAGPKWLALEYAKLVRV